MATAYAPPLAAHPGGIGPGGNVTTTSSTTPYQQSTKDASGFKVYGSLFKVDARYQFLNPLGKGSYGIVCAAKDRETGLNLAIKKVTPMAKRTADAKHTLREVLLLQLLGRHPNIISIHNLSTNLKDDELYIVMDLMDTDMHRVIQSSQALSESHVKYFLHQLLRGVKYLHDNGVLHRDLKPGNLLLSKTCQLKIADFGLARKIPKARYGSSSHSTAAGSTASTERPRSAPANATTTRPPSEGRAPMTEHVVTRWYRAPELMLQPDGFYDESVDMWSVGCIFAEILGRKALFPGKNFLHQLSLIFDVIGTPSPESTARIKSAQAQRFLKSLGKKPRVPFRSLFPAATDDAVDLLDKLLEFDPTRRISAHDALAHPYMQAIEKKCKAAADPAPNLRLDFSFESNKKLTKMDLRSLILKEVDTFRKSVAHVASAVDSELAEEEIREHGTRQSAAVATPSSARVKPQLQPSSSHAKSVVSGPGGSGHPSSAQSNVVMCGSAGMSMINSMLRQPVASASTSHNHILGRVPPDLNPGAREPPVAAVAIGSNRPRIRLTTKPPVPRQQPSEAPAVVSNQHQHHDDAPQYPTQLSHHSDRLAPHNPNGSHQLSIPTTANWSDSEPSMLTSARTRSVRPLSAAATKASAPALETTDTALPETRAFHFHSGDLGRREEIKAPDQLGAPSSHRLTPTAIAATASAPCDPAQAIAAAIALGERSKALISALSKPANATNSALATHKTAAGASRTAAWRAAAPAAHDSGVSVHNDVTTRDTGGARRTRKPECSSTSSSSESSSSDSDVESRQLRATVRNQTRAEPTRAAVSATLPRRAMSAGLTRVCTGLLVPVAAMSTTTAAPVLSNTPATFVGSTNSLIRAQRAGSGQTLAESANQMIAALGGSSGGGASQQPLLSQPKAFERDESVVFAPPVQSTASASLALKTQRSSSQLPAPPPTQQQQHQQQQDLAATKKPPKRLTVPKSPKFSVMSWQKKRSGLSVLRPRSAATASTGPSTAVTASVTPAVPATTRK